ncbi:DUF4064 domain-containing protein [Staphylococcus agnetis]|uniref:DUF4064 domain-containing protein n=1 Tax=Staphylococcus agnetis TaxID=985762 RepID=UPI00208F24E8|nr:DUF4064 domain-containing protein [Staphylococcus agnetis]MCO4351619.1 DUF4064 domain-containing protein [Staphylococcus agnetis]
MSDKYTYGKHDDNHLNNDRHQYDSYQHQKPFKRTAEKVLTWIGIVLHALYALLILGAGSFIPQLLKNKEFQQEFQKQGIDSNQVAQQSQDYFPVILYVGVPLLLALIAAFLFKKRILAGVILIIASILALFSASLIAALLWFIAAIMLFVRKPKPYHHVMANDSHDRDHVNHNHNHSHLHDRHDVKHSDDKRVEHEANHQHDVNRTNHVDSRHDNVGAQPYSDNNHHTHESSRHEDGHGDAHHHESNHHDLKDKGLNAKERLNDLKDDHRR